MDLTQTHQMSRKLVECANASLAANHKARFCKLPYLTTIPKLFLQKLKHTQQIK